MLILKCCERDISMYIICFIDGNPDAEDVFDDADLIPPLSPTGE